MTSGVFLTLDDYERINKGWHELEVWNRFMDQLDEHPQAFKIAMEENGGKPGNALFDAFSYWKTKQEKG